MAVTIVRKRPDGTFEKVDERATKKDSSASTLMAEKATKTGAMKKRSNFEANVAFVSTSLGPKKWRDS